MNIKFVFEENLVRHIYAYNIPLVFVIVQV